MEYLKITEEYYKGQEIIIIEMHDKTFIVDVRADDYDGDIVAGWEGMKSYEDALTIAKNYIDEERGR